MSGAVLAAWLLATTLVGQTAIFAMYPARGMYGGQWRTMIDSFTCIIPDTNTAAFYWRDGGVGVSLPTERIHTLPPWVPGNDPALGLPTGAAIPGIAWRAFYYGDTLVMWGYPVTPGYVGHLQFHTSLHIRPDSTAVFAGYWFTY